MSGYRDNLQFGELFGFKDNAERKLAALFCGMIESVDMTEVYCKVAGVVLFGLGLWLTDAVKLKEER